VETGEDSGNKASDEIRRYLKRGGEIGQNKTKLRLNKISTAILGRRTHLSQEHGSRQDGSQQGKKGRNVVRRMIFQGF
jgi:hypothetical protein